MRASLNVPGSRLAAYLYKEYEDDDHLQGFFKAYNDAAQYYLDWFNGIALPYYPGLSGDLLTWVADGLYGQGRTQLASQLSAELGSFNTVEFNALAFNDGVPPSQTFYNLTDDVFQRILTWNFYKGDGRHFSMRWLKRRVARFLFGLRGIDPQPSDPTFTVGVETTSAIGAVITGGNCVITLDQSLLSLQAAIDPGILQLFKFAFEGGTLELPLGYTYAVSIVANFVALVRPNLVTSSGAQFTQTTPPVEVFVLGGSGIYSYVWSFTTSGLGGRAAVRTAAAGGLTTGISLAAGAAAQATGTGDLVGAVGGHAIASSTATGGLTGAAAQALTGAATAVTAASAMFANGARIDIDNPLGSTTTFTATGMSWGQLLTAVAVCVVTDLANGAVTRTSVTVLVSCEMPGRLLIEGADIALWIEGGNTPLVIEP